MPSKKNALKRLRSAGNSIFNSIKKNVKNKIMLMKQINFFKLHNLTFYSTQLRKIGEFVTLSFYWNKPYICTLRIQGVILS